MVAPSTLAYKNWPALRQNPHAPDNLETTRTSYFVRRWHSQDLVLLRHERQVEENVRMLAGQQWMFWLDKVGAFVDVEEFLTDEEKRWRQRPVFNRIMHWYLQRHAKMTQNPAIIGFLPGPDRLDALLAEMMDTWWKTVWREADVEDVLDRLCTWLLPGGRAHLLSRIDWTRGEWQEFRADAQVPVIHPETGQILHGPDGMPQMQQMPNVPHNAQGQPMGAVTSSGDFHELAPPHGVRMGQLMVDPLSPLEVRAAWGPTPWHLKQWIGRRVFLTAEEIGELYQTEVTAIAPERTTQGTNSYLLERLFFGAGYYGANEKRFGSEGTIIERKGYYSCLETWDRPCQFAGMEESPSAPGGRHTVVCEDTNQTLLDGPRECPYPFTGPIRTVEMIRIPGRNHGTSPQDAINGPQRTLNRLAGHQLEAAALQAHPIGLIARGTGLEDEEITNQPAQYYEYTAIPGVEPLTFVSPPPTNTDLFQTQKALLDFMVEMGNTQQRPGDPPTRDASGELVKELRWDRDLDLAPTMRRLVVELGRMAQDHSAMGPTLFPFDRIIQYTGQDNIARAVIVQPLLFKQGKIHVTPDAESMLPEGRGERQARVAWMYQQGLFGPIGTPQAIARFFELGRFPHLSRAGKPGGVDQTTAEQNLGAILQGTPAAQIQLFPWYDLTVHRNVFEQFMKAPEFKRIDPGIQNELAVLWKELYFQTTMPQGPPMGGPPGDPMGGGGGPAMDSMSSDAQDQGAALAPQQSSPGVPGSRLTEAH